MQNTTEVMKMVIILSHGNAQTVVARRTTYDAASSFGGVANVPITKSLNHAACNARARFQEDKERRRKEDKTTKEEPMQEVEEQKAKKLKLMEKAQRNRND
ncbi:hypothetical protein PR048_026101 [Dryococelus australis]|uniref:Uncharacterized protein n=1 Tax=Dryococelus australis TaxID=614101 RepID=A0ABQ9GKD8_9NEOP|nr:hypothetical protein PR048_026101 [Dryococelus australis]